MLLNSFFRTTVAKNQHFFRINVQIQDFSQDLIFRSSFSRTFQDPWEPCHSLILYNAQ